jgi:NAD(P)-dependent dehydrogenase (short-subunit alcohol dehydrogenase family)
MIDVNIKGVLYRIAAALPYMKQQQAGHFINVFSVAGHTDSASAQRIRKFYTRPGAVSASWLGLTAELT